MLGLSPLQFDKLWNVPSPILNNNTWSSQVRYIFFIDTDLICVHYEMCDAIVRKVMPFSMMNYFIMLAEAVIKCMLFYDDGVIEGRCNKSCLGLFSPIN